MTPVINPWIFYIIPVCENIGILCWVLGSITAFATVFFCIGWSVEVDCWNRDEDKIKLYKRCAKKTFILAIVMMMVAILIPNEETVTKMLIAQNVTYERVDVVTDTVANVYNDIMALFQDSGAANG